MSRGGICCLEIGMLRQEHSLTFESRRELVIFIACEFRLFFETRDALVVSSPFFWPLNVGWSSLMGFI